MFAGDKDAERKAKKTIKELSTLALTKSHARHISMKKADDIGINVVSLEDNQDLQDAVLTVHHACIQTLSSTPACRIIENHLGIALIENVMMN
jgi:hypothetical protein